MGGHIISGRRITARGEASCIAFEKHVRLSYTASHWSLGGFFFVHGGVEATGFLVCMHMLHDGCIMSHSLLPLSPLSLPPLSLSARPPLTLFLLLPLYTSNLSHHFLHVPPPSLSLHPSFLFSMSLSSCSLLPSLSSSLCWYADILAQAQHIYHECITTMIYMLL